MSILIRLFKIIMNIIYFFIKLFPTKNKITMISRESNKEIIDFKLLREEIEKRNDFKVVVLCKKLEGNIFNKIGYFFHMFRQMYHIATSKVVILDTYCIFSYIQPLQGLFALHSSLLRCLQWIHPSRVCEVRRVSR